jgi:tRNA(Leu) C34 or U34 (ribose-2'-O)-methylase TrmL
MSATLASGRPSRIEEVEVAMAGMGKTPAIILVNPKYGVNVSSALRTCSVLGIPQLWITGNRWQSGWHKRAPREERMRVYGDVQVYRCDTPLYAFEGATPVCVEIQRNAVPLAYYEHPENAVYIFGPEDGSVPDWARRNSHEFLILPGKSCFNLSVAMGMVLMDRMTQRQRAGLEPVLPSYESTEDQRGWAFAEGGVDWP